jgi:hypothetical protein
MQCVNCNLTGDFITAAPFPDLDSSTNPVLNALQACVVFKLITSFNQTTDRQDQAVVAV